MLGGRDEHALAHERGGVGDLGDVAAGGVDFEVVEVRAAEDDAGAGGGGDEAHGDGGPGVQTHSLEIQWGVDGVLELWIRRQQNISRNVPQMKGIPG